MRGILSLLCVALCVHTGFSQTNTFPSSGNVGIGTTTPSVWFQSGGVFELTAARPVFKLTSSGTLGTIVFTNNAVSSSSHYGEFHLNHDFNASDPATSRLTFGGYPGGNVLTVVANGNVGIGTSTVSNVHGHERVLEVRGAAHSKIIASSSSASYITAMYSDPNWGGLGGGFIGTETNQNLYLFSNHAVHAALTTAGNLGIGTTTPSSKLQVVGGGTSTVDLLVNGRIQTGDAYNLGGVWLNNPGTMFVGQLGASKMGLYNAADWRLIVDGAGNVGIGTATPTSKLHVSNTGTVEMQVSTDVTSTSRSLVSFTRGSSGWNIGMNINQTNTNDLHFRFDGTTYPLTLQSGGNVGIGTTSPDAKLSVKGQVHAQEVKVDLNGAVAPDYVFSKDYKLPSLEEIRSYIEKNNHLPEVPSAKEIEENGMNLGEMNLLLLKKVEELTLYIISQNQTLGVQQEKLEKQAERIDRLEQSRDNK